MFDPITFIFVLAVVIGGAFATGAAVSGDTNVTIEQPAPIVYEDRQGE